MQLSILKIENSTDVSNLKQISLLPLTGKIIEKIILLLLHGKMSLLLSGHGWMMIVYVAPRHDSSPKTWWGQHPMAYWLGYETSDHEVTGSNPWMAAT